VEARTVSLFWRIFAVNAGLLALIALLLVVTPVTIQAPPTLTEVLIIVIGLAVTVAANALLLRRALTPLERLAQRMDTVDLLRPGQRLQAVRDDEVGRVVHAFNAMLDRLESERQRSARRVLAAQEAERVGIARDLHDAVGQLLTGVLLELNSIAEAAPEHRREIDETKETVRGALDEVRRISSELRPEMLEHLGLVSALTELTTTFGRVSGIDIERDFDPSLPQLAPETELAVYRIAQESLTNVVRHAGAQAVDLSLRYADGVVLTVTDDGCGIGDGVEGAGIRGMRERALRVGAELSVGPHPDAGTEVRLRVPLRGRTGSDG
jgi:two-component system, NarL family, sensor histidine kinase UhpB